MLLSHFKRLCITSVTLIVASPAPTVVPRSIPLPSVLQQSVSVCAQSCLQVSIAERFPVACTGQDSIQCLCSRYSNGGESLGEVALGCVYSSCSITDKGAASAYNVCLGQKDAVVPTKTALTVSASSPTRTPSILSSSNSPATPTITTTLQSVTKSTQSIFIDSISSTLSATVLPTSTFAAAPAAANDTPRMTPAQIAGLSVAAVAAFIVAVALMAVSVCVRRRREQKQEFDSDEKGLDCRSKKFSTRISKYVPANGRPEPPKQLPVLPPKAAQKGYRYQSPGPRGHPAARPLIHAVQHNGVGTSNGSNPNLPLDQIGLAVSAELDGTPVPLSQFAKTQHNQARAAQRRSQTGFRPVSSMTQDTVFEEDEPPSCRRSSVLLPTPSVPIAPIRNLRSSRQTTVDNATGFPLPPGSRVEAPRRDSRKGLKKSELFLDIPRRHEQPQPKMLNPSEKPSSGQSNPAQPREMGRFASPMQMAAASLPHKISGPSPQPSSAGDIDDYYFTTPKKTTVRVSPAYVAHSRDSPKTMQIKSKTSRSTVSRTSSRTSTNFRDSGSSQTSFETADPSDPTPEDEDDDKQLSSDDNKLSPVAESPISNLRYPKVPRASNQLVPRSPRSPRSQQNFNNLRTPKSQPSIKRTQPSPSPRPAPSPSSMLQNRRKNLPPPLLETRVPLKLNAPKDMAFISEPLQDPFTSPPRRRERAHIRSNSTESWSTTPWSKIERQSRAQSGMWPKSPAMYEFDVVKPLVVKRKAPLSVRRHGDEMDINAALGDIHDAQSIKSPYQIPRLTPTRKGEDLFLSVGWGEGSFVSGTRR